MAFLYIVYICFQLKGTQAVLANRNGAAKYHPPNLGIPSESILLTTFWTC